MRIVAAWCIHLDGCCRFAVGSASGLCRVEQEEMKKKCFVSFENTKVFFYKSRKSIKASSSCFILFSAIFLDGFEGADFFPLFSFLVRPTHKIANNLCSREGEGKL